jgi:hypothetical protein
MLSRLSSKKTRNEALSPAAVRDVNPSRGKDVESPMAHRRYRGAFVGQVGRNCLTEGKTT